MPHRSINLACLRSCTPEPWDLLNTNWRDSGQCGSGRPCPSPPLPIPPPLHLAKKPLEYISKASHQSLFLSLATSSSQLTTKLHPSKAPFGSSNQHAQSKYTTTTDHFLLFSFKKIMPARSLAAVSYLNQKAATLTFSLFNKGSLPLGEKGRLGVFCA